MNISRQPLKEAQRSGGLLKLQASIEAREVKHRRAYVQSGGQLNRNKGSAADEKIQRSSYFKLKNTPFFYLRSNNGRYK